MSLMATARKLNSYIKKRKKNQAGKYLSLVRRVERTAPLNNRRVVAITFDDGPSAEAPNPNHNNHNKGLTIALLDILNKYNAKGTFNVIGTTQNNYPDKAGKLHSPSWGGVRYDHYPDYNKDNLAGIENQLDIAKQIIDKGHELSNHTYSHVLFGSNMIIYGNRVYHKTLDEVINDLKILHNLVKDTLNYDMKLSRPPHYIDKIKGGYTTYDAYSALGYNYLAASFDGGGWKPTSGEYRKDVQNMIIPLENTMMDNPAKLNGQIIFHKDGYNMSRQTPVVDALPTYLDILTNNGYEILTVSQLLELSPFEDVLEADPSFEYIKALEKTGYCIGYKDNTFKPDKYLTLGELATMVTPPEFIINHQKNLYANSALDISNTTNNNLLKNISPKHPYYSGLNYICQKGFQNSNSDNYSLDTLVSKKIFVNLMDILSDGINLNFSKSTNQPLKRRDVCETISSYIMQKSTV